MTQHNQILSSREGNDGTAAATEAGISSRLREFYNSVQDEEIPGRLLTLLERLDAAEKVANSSMSMEDSAR